MTPGGRHIHLDPLGGVAGDMLIAALLDAFPQHESAMRAAVAACGLPHGWALCVDPYTDGILSGRRFRVRGPAGASAPSHHHNHHHHPDNDHDHQDEHHHSHNHDHDHTHAPVHAHGHDHDHHHHAHATGRWADIRARLNAAPLAAGVRTRAIAIFSDIAEAEAQVHGKAVEDVTFHEIADWDSVADVVGAAALFEAVGPDTTWSTAPLPLGGGLVETAHGWLPVPAPATALLLAGLPVTDDGIPGERVTPTGVALIRHLAPSTARPPGPFTIARVGTGFGTRRLAGRSNVLRALVLEPTTEAAAISVQTDLAAVLTFEVDDQTPEDLAIGLDHLRQTAGVLDVLQAPVFAKKGRLATQIQVLCQPDRTTAVAAACLNETTTLGVRHQIVTRSILQRCLQSTTDGPVKVATRPMGNPSAKLEAEALTALSGADPRARRRRAAVAEALANVEDSE